MRSPNAAALPRAHPPAAAGGPATHRNAHRTVAVVTDDDTFAATLRAATPDRTVMTVATPFALADLLLQEATAVVVIDNAAVGGSAARLIDQLAEQFPELALIAVGTRAEEAAHAAQLSDGRLYRFLHRPVSAERTRTFVEAALRRHEDRRPAARHARPGRSAIALGALCAALAALAGLAGLMLRPAPRPDATPAVAATPQSTARSGFVARPGSPAPVSRAPRAAHAAGRTAASAPAALAPSGNTPD
jgi:ActR/RegA family two-component response regulator